MKIVINPTVEDGSMRAAAILKTQDDLRRAMTMRSPRLDDVAWQTLVQTSVGVRTLGALVADAVEYDDASGRSHPQLGTSGAALECMVPCRGR